MIYFISMIGIVEAMILFILVRVYQDEREKNEQIQTVVTDLMTSYWKQVIDYNVVNPMHYLSCVRNVNIMDVTKNEGFEKQIESLFNQRKQEEKIYKKRKVD